MHLRALVTTFASIAVAVAVAACGGSSNPAGTVDDAVTVGPPESSTVIGGSSAAAPAETESSSEAPAGDAAAGKAVFTSNCGGCHTLADAATAGAVGPNLDEAKPDAALVTDRVTNGKGVMPPFKDKLSEEDIANVAAYVSSVAGA